MAGPMKKKGQCAQRTASTDSRVANPLAPGSRRTRGPWLLLAASLLLLPLLPFAGEPGLRPEMGSGNEHQDCNNCHGSHRNPSRLLNLRSEEPSDACAGCHQGKEESLAKGGAVQIPEWRGQESSHLFQSPMERSSQGHPYVRTYEAGGRKGFLLPGCTACHDPHAKDKRKLKDAAFNARGDWVGPKASNSAQICFGCHAGPESVKLSEGFGPARDLGSRFANSARSRHAIGGSAKDRPDVPSLNGTRFSGRMDCISCHDNPDESGPRGPHVSIYPHLLAASYGRELESSLGERSNDLCYKCHDQISVEGDQSFPYHRAHIRGFIGGPGQRTSSIEEVSGREEKTLRELLTVKNPKPGRQRAFMPGFGEPTPCATCHDPHGSLQNPALVEFDTTVVSPSTTGVVEFQQTGPGRGSCTLNCHGYNHVNVTY